MLTPPGRGAFCADGHINNNTIPSLPGIRPFSGNVTIDNWILYLMENGLCVKSLTSPPLPSNLWSAEQGETSTAESSTCLRSNLVPDLNDGTLLVLRRLVWFVWFVPLRKMLRYNEIQFPWSTLVQRGLHVFIRIRTSGEMLKCIWCARNYLFWFHREFDKTLQLFKNQFLK